MLQILFPYLAGDITSFPGAAFSLLKITETQEEESDKSTPLLQQTPKPWRKLRGSIIH
jgi:hypothetical protein